MSDYNLTIEKRVLPNGKTVLVVINDDECKRLRADNRRDYERRLEHTKGCRANIFGNI